MAASSAFLELLHDLFAPLGTVTAKRMFGGASIYAEGVLFALVDDDILYLKADHSTQTRFEAEGLGPFTYQGKTDPVPMAYWRAPERLYDEPDEMLEWAREAVGVALKAKKLARPPMGQSQSKAKSKRSRIAAQQRPTPQSRKRPKSTGR